MTHDGMWQDSGRYEWPLTGAYPLCTADSTGTPIDTRRYPERANQEIAALRHQVAELRARMAELERAADGRTL